MGLCFPKKVLAPITWRRIEYGVAAPEAPWCGKKNHQQSDGHGVWFVGSIFDCLYTKNWLSAVKLLHFFQVGTAGKNISASSGSKPCPCCSEFYAPIFSLQFKTHWRAGKLCGGRKTLKKMKNHEKRKTNTSKIEVSRIPTPLGLPLRVLKSSPPWF